MSGGPPALEYQSEKSTGEIRAAYDEEEAEDYGDLPRPLLYLMDRTRSRQFGDVGGRVLDVACGTGENFEHLPGEAALVGIDLSEDMLTVARERATELGRRVELEQMDAERLSFEADSFDYVVSALSTCTFPNPIEALDEMGRVCEPDGEVRLLDHHRWQVGPLARFQEWMRGDEYDRVGCRLYDDPATVVRESSLEVVRTQRWRFPPFTGVVARPPEE